MTNLTRELTEALGCAVRMLNRNVPQHIRLSIDKTLEKAWKSGHRCHSDRDGECSWSECPQLRDGEPEFSNRHCPLDNPPERD